MRVGLTPGYAPDSVCLRLITEAMATATDRDIHFEKVAGLVLAIAQATRVDAG